MTIPNRKQYAGRPDINAQFTVENIGKTLADYKEVKDRGGDYTFGALTAKYYDLDTSATGAWEYDLNKEYPKDVQEEIKRHIIHALTHRDHHGHEAPIPLTIKWGGLGKKKTVLVTYNTSPPSYQIQIDGFLGPAASTLAARRAKKK
jgi:hypothetical protein